MKNKIVILLSLLALISCGQKPTETDTLTSGTIQISVDESFEPIIRQEIIVFENKYLDATIIPIYTNEVEAINLLLKDSVRLAITTRKLKEQEKQHIAGQKLFAREVKLATDGIAIITNKQNKDTLITVSQLRNIMMGEVTRWNEIFPASPLGNIELVFDNPNSSTVRFAIETICNGKPLSEKLFAQRTNPEVIEHVAHNPNAIGVIGVSWVGNKADTTRLSFLDDITLMSVSAEKTATKANSFKPIQYYLNSGDYPLTREVFAISTDPKNGLPTGFVSFLTSDIGQRIILKEGLVPATQIIRAVHVKDDF